MQIAHVALWTKDLERSRDFYATYFGGKPSSKYRNAHTGFESYFVTFEGGARLELMWRPGVSQRTDAESLGFAHVAFACASVEEVDALTDRLRAARVKIAGEPRWTGDGCYESVALDPDGNRVEIVLAAPGAAGL